MGFNAKTNWKLNDTVMPEDLNRIEEGIKNSAEKAELKAVQKFQLAGGTATAIVLSEVLFEDGFSKTFVVKDNNNQTPTTVNGKALYKPGTAVTPNLKANKAVTVWYNSAGDCFFIKASAEGNAVAEHVLAGKTFSNDDDTGIVGTMVNNGPVSAEIIDLSTEGAEYTIAKGFHSGFRKIRAKISGLVASVIKSGTNVGGITGTFTSDATAVAGDILSGKTAYKNGSKLTGTMVDRGTVNHNLPINGSFTIPAGKHSGSGKVTQDIPTKGAETITPGATNKTIGAGQYLSGAQTILGDPDLIPSKIPEDVNLFGVQGTRSLGKKFASGTAQSSGGTKYFDKLLAHMTPATSGLYWVEVSGLTFKPSKIFIYNTDSRLNGKKFTVTIYQGDVAWQTAGEIVQVFDAWETDNNSSTSFYKAQANSAYVTSSGFLLPYPDKGIYVTWVAFE